jgi:hypothetical protein
MTTSDSAEHIECPRAKTWMTPCAARDGHLACLDDGRCVGCNEHPADLLTDLVPKYLALRDATGGDS